MSRSCQRRRYAGRPMLPPVLAAVLAATIGAPMIPTGPALPPAPPTAIRSVPDEPGAFVLPEAEVYQAVVADLDGDGAREIVRLVAGERTAIEAEAWGEERGEWALLGQIEVAPPAPVEILTVAFIVSIVAGLQGQKPGGELLRIKLLLKLFLEG